MLLLLDIFSINKGRGYENPSLEIIVIERYLIGGCPLEEACEHFFLNQSVISIVVLISFLCYCGDCAGYITVILPFLAFYFCSAYLLNMVSCSLGAWVIPRLKLTLNGKKNGGTNSWLQWGCYPPREVEKNSRPSS
jgi:hypothetical protein